MENRRKFYGLDRKGNPIPNPGNWSDDTFDDRYNHINDVLKVHSIIDDEDLKFIIKNAFISRIYISVEAAEKIRGEKLNSLQPLYDQLIRDGVLNLQDGKYGSRLSPYFDICKLGDKGLGISIEHVVPGEVCKKAALKSFSKSDFANIFNNAYICLVTSGQAKALDKKWKDNLPPIPGIVPESRYDFTKHPFARYDHELGGVSIDIYGWGMKDGKLSNNHKEKGKAI